MISLSHRIIKLRIFSLLALFLFYFHSASGQSQNDAIYMPKNTVCFMGAYGNSSWDHYWEGNLKRDNLNIGTNTTQSFLLMSALGLSDKLNLIASLPYISTSNSAGNLLGQKGLQDLSLSLKYKVIQKNKFSLSVALGGSIPMSNYVPSFLPMSIGLQAASVSGRLIANYHHSNGFYITLQGAYTHRDNINIDADSYQSYQKLFYTNEVLIPNTVDGGLNIGYFKNSLQAMFFVEKLGCLSGDNIRRNDMPFPTNQMEFINIGSYIKYQPKRFGINLRVSYTTSGRNVGQSLAVMSGLLYQFPFKTEKTAK